MNRKLASRNLRTAVLVAAFCVFLFAMTFVAAAVYIS